MGCSSSKGDVIKDALFELLEDLASQSAQVVIDFIDKKLSDASIDKKTHDQLLEIQNKQLKAMIIVKPITE
jgi:hypothetical protein